VKKLDWFINNRRSKWAAKAERTSRNPRAAPRAKPLQRPKRNKGWRDKSRSGSAPSPDRGRGTR